jgi:hypothetical protein
MNESVGRLQPAGTWAYQASIGGFHPPYACAPQTPSPLAGDGWGEWAGPHRQPSRFVQPSYTCGKPTPSGGLHPPYGLHGLFIGRLLRVGGGRP